MQALRAVLRRWLSPRRRVTRAGTTVPNAAAPGSAPTTRTTPPARPAQAAPPGGLGGYPGDFTGIPELRWAPCPDGRPDPGEVVWTWVPFEEDHSRGKDRPVLLVGRDGPWLLGVPLTSKDHDRDLEQERRAGREWIDVGSGSWDSRGRPSEARVDRIIRLDPQAVRREGAVLPRAVFNEVAAAILADRNTR